MEVSDYTGFPELFDGRVKTLHPKVHGGLLYRRDNPEHIAQAKANDIPPIDLVVVNLYPFEQTVAKPDVTLEEAIENIDIGGPSMLRSAAKNHASVTVITDPADYARVIEEMKENNGKTTKTARAAGHQSLPCAPRLRRRHRRLPRPMPDRNLRQFHPQPAARSGTPLRRQPAPEGALYGNFGDFFKSSRARNSATPTSSTSKPPSDLILDFVRPTVAILKHTNPCGVGQDDEDLRVAWEKAFETDRQAPFGGVIVCNRPLTWNSPA